MGMTDIEKQSEAARLREVEAKLLGAHLNEPTSARRRQAPAPEAVDIRPLVAEHNAVALDGVGRFSFYERRVARELARATAQHQAELERDRRAREHAAEQARLDEQWERLNANDPDAVLTAVGSGLAGTTARAIAAEDDYVLVALVIEEPEALVPERKEDYTPTGKLSVKKRSKTERNEFYADALASASVAAARRAFAAAPGIEHVDLVVVRKERSGLRGREFVALYAGGFTRELTAQVRSADALAIVLRAEGAMFEVKGRTDEVAALDLSDAPEAQEVLEQVGRALGAAAKPVKSSRKLREQV